MATTKKQEDLFDKKSPAPVTEVDGFGNTKKGKEKRVIIPRVIPSPVKSFTSNIGRGRANTLRWENPQWDLAECGRILDTEAFVRRAFRNNQRHRIPYPPNQIQASECPP